MRTLSESSTQALRDQRRRNSIAGLPPTFKVLAVVIAAFCLLLTSGVALAQSGVPTAPSIDSVVKGNESLLVSWSAPSSNGGSDIIAYDLRRIETGAMDKADANWSEEQDAWTSGDLEYTVSGLSNGTEYDVQVRAVNTNGDGAWSTTVTGIPDGPWGYQGDSDDPAGGHGH